MKKILILIELAVAVGITGSSGAVTLAASTCQVGYTGPDSHNLCTQVTTEKCVISNNNTVTIDGENVQLATSGNAGAGGNGAAGGAQSGSVTNTNGTTINVTVNNPGTCVVTRTIPATISPTPPTKTTKSSPTVAAPVAPTAKQLPNTSADSPLPLIVGLFAATALGAELVRLGMYAYRRHVS